MKKKYLIFLIGIIIFVSPCFGNLSMTRNKENYILLKTSTPQIVKTVTTSIYADKDAYISMEDKDLGWGNVTYWILEASDNPYSGIDRLFWPHFFFNYKDFPYDIEEAGIRLSPHTYDYAFQVKFHLVNSDWDEYNICYNNRPEYIEQNIYHGTVTGWANMTNYIFDRTNISIMVSADFIEGRSVRAEGHTREKVHAYGGVRPRLILSYSALFDIIITNPSNNITLRNGDCIPIRWITVGPIDNVKIEIFKDNSFINTINSSTENDGFYNWTVGYPEKYEGKNYTIKVSDVLNSDVYEYSHSFTIQGSASFDPSAIIILGSIIGVASVVTIITLIVRKRSKNM